MGFILTGNFAPINNANNIVKDMQNRQKNYGQGELEPDFPVKQTFLRLLNHKIPNLVNRIN